MPKKLKIPTYHDVIAEARAYRDSDSAEDLADAERLLREGMAKYPYALPIADELALVLERLNREREAEDLLKDLAGQLGDAGEETLCRFGKIHKKRAHRLAKSHNPAAALAALVESEHYYGRAYQLSFSFYPRINQLTARFLQAALKAELDAADESGVANEAEELVGRVRRDAAGMLVEPNIWQPRLDDDDIWIPATQGEVYFLLGDWSKAEEAYREAMNQAKEQVFYYRCMRGQVELLLEACKALGHDVPPPLATPQQFFQPPA